MFQKIQECSRRFLNVPEDSSVPEDSKMFQKVLKCPIRSQNIPECSRMF